MMTDRESYRGLVSPSKLDVRNQLLVDCVLVDKVREDQWGILFCQSKYQCAQFWKIARNLFCFSKEIKLSYNTKSTFQYVALKIQVLTVACSPKWISKIPIFRVTAAGGKERQNQTLSLNRVQL